MEENDREELDDLVRKEVTKLFETVLDYTSIAVSDVSTFKVLRGKILRVGNDCIRKITSELVNYDVTNVERDEDVIEVKHN